MRCPWCEIAGEPRALHAHFSEAHPEQVRFQQRGGRRLYALSCPVCGAGYEHEIKPRLRDPAFMEEFQGEIRLVAFDMLINHLLVEHEPGAAHVPGAEEGPSAEDVPSAEEGAP